MFTKLWTPQRNRHMQNDHTFLCHETASLDVGRSVNGPHVERASRPL